MYTGEKVKLREYKKEDVKPAQSYVNNPEVKRLLTPGIPFPNTLEDEEKWVESLSATKDVYSFAIETLQDNKYIGGCGINSIDWKNSVALVGIFIGDKDYWGKGYGTEAVKKVVDFGFNVIGLNRIEAFITPENYGSIKVLKKLNFIEEGIVRERDLIKGKLEDGVIMAMLKRDFKE